jgi:hypothetical protein
VAGISIGLLAPRWRTEVKFQEPYIVVEQDSDSDAEDGSVDTVSVHVGDIDEFIELLKRAKQQFRKPAAPPER